MMIQMLVDTGIADGTFVHKGDVFDTDSHTAKRWFAHGIAKMADERTLNVEPWLDSHAAVTPDAMHQKPTKVEVESSSVSEVPTSESDDIQPSAVSEKKKTAKQHKDK